MSAPHGGSLNTTGNGCRNGGRRGQESPKVEQCQEQLPRVRFPLRAPFTGNEYPVGTTGGRREDRPSPVADDGQEGRSQSNAGAIAEATDL